MNKTIVDNIHSIISHFNLNLRESTRYYIGPCPIHKGDNTTAFNFYHTGHTYVGNWRCNTHDCHKEFQSSAIGLIQGLLSVQRYNWSKINNQKVSIQEAISWCEEFFNITYKKNNQVSNLASAINKICAKNKKSYEIFINKHQYLDSGVTFPDKYFLNRGYSAETLLKFEVGYCKDPTKSMYCRSVVPLYSASGYNIIGYAGRAIWEKCNICDCYHNPNSICPTKEKKHIYSKWKNSKGFPSGSELYNFHRAKQYIKQTGIVILTEGQPNVWRLSEAGFDMSVACFGAKFSLDQKKVLDSSGAHTIIIVPDADEASQNLIDNITEICKKLYNIVTIEPSYDDDIGKCNIDTVKTLLLPFIQKHKEK